MTNSYSKIPKFVFYSAIFCLVSACGLKGDLYLPDAQPQVVNSTPVESISSQEMVEQTSDLDETKETPQPSKFKK